MGLLDRKRHIAKVRPTFAYSDSRFIKSIEVKLLRLGNTLQEEVKAGRVVLEPRDLFVHEQPISGQKKGQTYICFFGLELYHSSAIHGVTNFSL